MTNEQAGTTERMSAALEMLRSGPPKAAPTPFGLDKAAAFPLSAQSPSRWQTAKASITEKKRAMIHAVERLQAKAALSPRVEGRIKTVEE